MINSGYVKKSPENYLPRGRKKGQTNKSTAKAKEAIAKFVDGKAYKIERWLDEIEKEHGPLQAFNSFIRLAEYHVPKLARTELTGKDEGPVELSVKWSNGK
jgi:hypothetical protein